MKRLKKNQKKYFIIMLVLLIVSFTLFRINNFYTNLMGLILFPIIIVIGFLMLKEDKR